MLLLLLVMIMIMIMTMVKAIVVIVAVETFINMMAKCNKRATTDAINAVATAADAAAAAALYPRRFTRRCKIRLTRLRTCFDGLM